MGTSQKLLVGFIAAVLLSGCAPAPEERYARAVEYFDDADYRAVVLELKNALQDRPDYAEARLLLGRASYQLADFATAQIEAERALAQGLDTPEAWAELGKALLAQGDAAGALERVVPNLDAETATAEQLVLLGDTFLSLGNLGDAAAFYARALGLDPATPGALIGQAVIARQNQEPGRAEALLQQAVELNPGSALAWRARGNYLRASGLHAEAADAYDRSIAAETGATPLAERLITRINRVSALVDSRELEDAQAAFTELESSFPRHSIVHFIRGRLAYAMGDYQLAEAELREYLADIPDDLRGYALLGAVNFSQNHLRQAEMYLSQAARNNVGGAATARLLAETRLRLNKPAEALSTLGAPSLEGEMDPSLLAMYGRAQLGLGNTAAALDYFEQGAAAGTLTPSLGLSLAAGFFAAGDSARAIELLEGLPEDGDGNYRRETLLIAAHIRENNKAEALRVGGEVLEANPEDPSAYSLVGALQQALGDFVAARTAFERALALDPKHQSALYSLGRLEMIEGNSSKAEGLISRLLDVNPASMPGLVTLAGIYVDADRLGDLMPRLDAAVAAEDPTAGAYLLKTRVLLIQGEADAAVKTIAAARTRFPDDLRFVHAEGIAFVQQDKMEAALESLRRAANEDPANTVFQFDYASLSFSNGDLNAAQTAISRYRKLQPDNYRGLAMQVAILARRGNYAAARAEVAAFQDSYPDVSSAAILAGDLEMAAGDAAQAARRYEAASRRDWSRDVAIRLARAYELAEPSRAPEPLSRWLEDHPDDTEVRRVYGQYLEATGDTAAAVAEYERLLQSDQADPIALNNLAWQYAMDGKPGAVELAARAHELAPENGSISDTYGWILFLNGNVEDALPLLEQAAAQSPDNPEVRFHLAAAYAKVGKTQRANELLSQLLASGSPFPSRDKAQELADSL